MLSYQPLKFFFSSQITYNASSFRTVTFDSKSTCGSVTCHVVLLRRDHEGTIRPRPQNLQLPCIKFVEIQYKVHCSMIGPFLSAAVQHHLNAIARFRWDCHTLIQRFASRCATAVTRVGDCSHQGGPLFKNLKNKCGRDGFSISVLIF